MTRTGRTLLLATVGVIGLMLATRQAWAFTPFGCQPGQQFGCGDDSGFFPPDAPTGPVATCENRVMLAVARLFKCIAGCHVRMVLSGTSNDAAEDGCEANCQKKYTKRTATVTGCLPCSDPGNLAVPVETLVDQFNFNVYCASPSGAFLDASDF